MQNDTLTLKDTRLKEVEDKLLLAKYSTYVFSMVVKNQKVNPNFPLRGILSGDDWFEQIYKKQS